MTIETCDDVALLAADESQTDKNIIDAMIGDGVDELKVNRQEVCGQEVLDLVLRCLRCRDKS